MSAGERSWSPAVSAKTAQTGTAGALATVLVWSLSLAGIDMPAYVAAAVGVLVTTACAYFIPTRKPGRYEA